jgi:hypothetical protein
MNDMIEPTRTWTAYELTDEGKAAFFKAALERRENIERDAKTIRKVGLWTAAGGILVGIFGMGAGLTAYIKTPVPDPPGYIVIDRSTGWITEPLTARNAPKEFSEAVRQRAIRDFIVACTSYIPQTWAKLDWHACMIQATPDQQKRLASDMGGKESPLYPPSIFGPNGWAMATDFPIINKIGETGTAPNQVFHYDVRYQRTEVAGGRETRARYSAQMTFTFRPDLRMSPADRLINPSGLQVISFSTVRE